MTGGRGRAHVAGVCLGILVVGLGVAAYSRWSDGDESDAGSRSRWSAAVTGLCTATEQARAGDVAGARRTFLDDSHDPLHLLANEVSEDDRGAAAELLEAKERVESELEQGPASLSRDLEALVAATRDAIRTTDGPVPGPCP